MRRRHTPPTPLERGGSGVAFLLVMSGLWCVGFPSREGRFVVLIFLLKMSDLWCGGFPS